MLNKVKEAKSFCFDNDDDDDGACIKSNKFDGSSTLNKCRTIMFLCFGTIERLFACLMLRIKRLRCSHLCVFHEYCVDELIAWPYAATAND